MRVIKMVLFVIALVVMLIPGQIIAQDQNDTLELNLEGVTVTRSEFTTDEGDGEAPWCVPDEYTLCLRGGRFTVRFVLNWDSVAMKGHAVSSPFQSTSGGFWVYSPDNPELVIKILDGCKFDNRYWFFVAGLTDRSFLLEVRDNLRRRMILYGKARGYVLAFRDVEATICP